MKFLNIVFWFIALLVIEKCNSDCHTIRTGRGNNTLVNIIYNKHEVIWIKPEQSFVRIKFVPVKETMFGFQLDREHDEYLTIYKPTFKPNQWNYISFNLLKKAKSFEPDLYSLEATVNGITKFKKITRLWWVLIVVKSTKVYVSGESEMSFNCLPMTTTTVPTTLTFASTTPTIETFKTTVAIANTSTGILSNVTADIFIAMRNVANNYVIRNHAATITPIIVYPLAATENTTSTSKNTIAASSSETPTNKINTNLNLNGGLIGKEKYNLRNDEHRPTIPIELRQTKTTEHEISKTEGNSYLVTGFNITLAFLCLCLVVVLISIIIYYRGKLKKLGGTDLSNIESIDPKNKTNHYEEILKCGKTGKNETFYEELKVKPDVIKNIQWNIATDLKNSNMEREQDEDHSYDKPKSVKSETEETIYEELPEDFKALKNEK